MRTKSGNLLAMVCALAALVAAQAGHAADAPKIVFAIPGVPPIYSTVIAYVADKEGLFKKYGADVELRQFDNGTAGARAVVAGDADLAMSPTPLIISQIANADIDLVAIYGLPNPDWAIGSTDAKKASCKDLAGQPVGVDTPGGARSLALKSMLAACGMKSEQVQEVALGSQTAGAMAAGQITFGVLHLDDAPEIESHGKSVTIVTTLAKSVPESHYILAVARRDRLKEKRDGFVGMLAGLIAAGRFMSDPKNADAVAEIGTVTGHTKEISKGALARFLAIGFWAVDNDGLDRAKLDAVTKQQVEIGNVKPGKTAPDYDRLVDRSVWRDADALVKN
jgi:NitT/TauT family transport system substrate-binding protein